MFNNNSAKGKTFPYFKQQEGIAIPKSRSIVSIRIGPTTKVLARCVILDYRSTTILRPMLRPYAAIEIRLLFFLCPPAQSRGREN